MLHKNKALHFLEAIRLEVQALVQCLEVKAVLCLDQTHFQMKNHPKEDYSQQANLLQVYLANLL